MSIPSLREMFSNRETCLNCGKTLVGNEFWLCKACEQISREIDRKKITPNLEAITELMSVEEFKKYINKRSMVEMTYQEQDIIKKIRRQRNE